MKTARLAVVVALLALAGSVSQAVTLQAGGSPTAGDPNLRLWLDASDLGTLFQDTGGATPVTADGQLVARWNDKSGNFGDGYVSEASTSHQPDYRAPVAELNGQPALFFEGRNDGNGWLGDVLRATNSTGITGNDDRTVVTVWANAANTGQNYQHTYHMGRNASNQAYGISAIHASTGKIGNHYWASGFDTTVNGTADPTVAVAVWDGDGGTGTNGLDSWHVDGAYAGASDRAVLDTGTTQITIGSRLSPYTEGIRGDVAEVIVYDTALTWEQHDRLGKYLADKYALATTYLGTGHLYQEGAPGAITWHQARAAAQAQAPPKGYNRGDLVSITSQAENDVVHGLITSQAWIGANDEASEGKWVWSDGSGQFWEGKGSGAGGHPVGGMYSNWSGTSEPNDSGPTPAGEDFASMYTSGAWNDLYDTYTLSRYVVEFTPNTTYHDFGGAGTPYTATQYGGGTGPVVQDADHTNNYMRLLHGTNNQQNVVAFDRTALEAWQTVTATFDLRLDPGADGMGFALLNTADYGTTGAGPSLGAWEEPNLDRSFAVGFDIYNNIHEVSLHWNGKAIATSQAFDYRTGSTGPFNPVELTVDYVPRGANVSLSIAGNAFFTDYFIQGMYPHESRVCIGARTGGVNTTLDVDNINVEYDTLWHSHVWGGGTGSYTDGTQWNVGTVPGASDNALIASGQANSSGLTINGPGTVTVAGTGTLNNSGSLEVGNAAGSDGVFVQEDGDVDTNTLYLGRNATARGTYIMTGGQLDLGSYMVVGTSGVGVFLQSGGTVNQPNAKFILGDVSGSHGNVYDLSGDGVVNANELSIADKTDTSGTFTVRDSATLTTKSTAYVGMSGNGTLNQTGGTVNANNWLILGENAGSTGTYDLSGDAVLNVKGSYFIIGRSGVGHFYQSDDSLVDVNVGTRFILCDFGGSSGSFYNMSGGTLNINNGKLMAIGKGDTGEFFQTGGTVNATGDVSLGESGTGTYKLRGGSLNVTGSIVNGGGTGNLEFDGGALTVGGNIDVDSLRMGVTGSANPTLSLSGQSLNVTGDMIVGQSHQATMSLTDTTTTIGGRLRVAPNANGNGSIVQDGGSMVVGGRFELADNATGTASYELTGGGTLTVNGDYVIVGRRGQGTFTQSGGSVVTVNVSQRLLVGDVAGSDGSSYTLSDGTLNINNGKEMSIGKAGNAEFVQNGGLVHATGNIRLGEDTGYTGTYTLAGGTLNLHGNTLFVGNGSGVFNFTGGTLLDAGTVGFALTNDGGIIAPGASPGKTTIDGNFIQTPDGVYQIELGGTDPADYDQILVNGTATVSGMLDVATWGSYVLSCDDSFDVVVATDGVNVVFPFDIAYTGQNDLMYRIVDVAQGQALQLYGVPEPTTLGLVGLGSLVAVLRRRRRR